jgi:upstream activation factor subunit UAF30
MLAAKLQAELNGRFLRDSKKKRRRTQTGVVQKKTRKVTDGVRKNPFHAELQLSPVLADILGFKQLSRPQVVREIWVYIRKHNLQNPENKREIICDEKFRQIFGEKTDIFHMNKLLKPHLYKADEVVGGGELDDQAVDEDAELPQSEPPSQQEPTESDLEAQALEAALEEGQDDDEEE